MVVIRGLSFADAVAVLGGRADRTVAALDRLTGGLLLATSATGVGLAVNLFDPKREFARLSGDLALKVGDRLRGLSRLDRTERLAAAQAILVLAAYFEVLGEVRLPLDIKELELTSADQVGLITDRPASGKGLWRLADSLLHVNVPMLAPQRSHEDVLAELSGFYRSLSAAVRAFVSGLAVWDGLDYRQRNRFADALRVIPDLAVTRFEELFRRLVVECPELAFWSSQLEHQATRADIRRLTTGLTGVEKVLVEVGDGRVPAERCLALARVYQSALRRPILPGGESPEGLRMPLLGDAYINPDFRAAQLEHGDRFVDESWWEEQPVRDDLAGFLIGHLTTRQAVEAPVLVLGQPGSGKSLLTQILAARLPPSDFLVVRVALREVSADADLQTQIEQAIRAATGEQITWPTLVRSAGGAAPVVLLDGFDELLQTTGVSQSDYLERVQDFQLREADLGRAVVVLVTSRTAVADRARPPLDMIVLRLEPFRDDHIAQWLTMWSATNESWFAVRGLRPPQPESILARRQLACQPLLLLMLALYDADGNALQGSAATMGQGELYERLLTRFAEREIRKAIVSSEAETEHAIDRELLRLSVAAFAMFNRRRQWVTQAELDGDLATLITEPIAPQAPGGMRAELTAAELMIGRFFFIHRAQATRDTALLQTYEFLHATFGEYLIGRLITRELNDLANAVEFSASRGRSVPIDGSFLRALLSFAPLTMRSTVVSFLTELVHELPEPRRTLIGDVLLTLFRSSLQPRHPSSYDAYEPDPIPVPARYAAYSANLVLLAVLIRGRVSGRELFPDRTYPVDEWRSTAMLWRAQLPLEGWRGLMASIALVRDWDGGKREIYLHLQNEPEPSIPLSDPYWTYRFPPDHAWRCRKPSDRFGWVHSQIEDVWRQSHFQCDERDDTVSHALEPLNGVFGTAVVTFHDSYDDWPIKGPVSAAHALLRLLLAVASDGSTDELVAAHQACLRIALDGFAPDDIDGRDAFRVLTVRQLRENRHRLPNEFLHRAAQQIQAAEKADRKPLTEDLKQLARDFLPELRELS